MKLNLTLSVATLAGLVACAAPSVNAQSVINNGSFETGDFTSWNPSDASWVIDSGSFINAFPAQDGSFYALLLPNGGATSTFDQTFATTTGETYSVNFWANLPFNNVGLAVTAGGVTGTLIPVGSSNPEIGANWQDYSFNFTASGDSTDIAFAGISNGGFMGVDNVTVVPVPEPTTLALSGLGALGLALWRQRRVA